MRVNQCLRCEKFPCADVRHERYLTPSLEIAPESVSIVMISECAPEKHRDYYYAGGEALFEKTTVQAFQAAGAKVSSILDIVDLGVYLTTAVKCGKNGYGIAADTVKECSRLLEKEIALFPNVKAFLLMGDVAIKAANAIALRRGEGRAVPAGSTYRIRGLEYVFRGQRAFPSYLQAGPSYFIEKSKRAMIAEDIAAALCLASRN